MNILSKGESIKLLIGDLFLFTFSLWLTLLIRYGETPDYFLFYTHLLPFSTLFIVWILIFHINSLYDKHTATFKSKLPTLIVRAQIVNVAIAALFFFTIPYFGITPKTNLIIYLVVSSLLIIIWRTQLVNYIKITRKENVLLLGIGKELKELYTEMNSNDHRNTNSVIIIDVEENPEVDLNSLLTKNNITTIIADGAHEKVRSILVKLFHQKNPTITLLEFTDIYEEIFERTPLSSVNYRLLFKTNRARRYVYLFVKRLFDIIGSIIITFTLLFLAPILWILMKFEDGGGLFIKQERIGQYTKPIGVYKFRTMLYNDRESSTWIHEKTRANKITRIGAFLRKTSIDELPQCINLFKGDMTLIGPRSDILGLGSRLSAEIKYYNARYKVKPGISGWAQVKQQYTKGNISPQSIDESYLRLAYDFYYIKHQSILLDFSIALRTVKTLLSRLI